MKKDSYLYNATALNVVDGDTVDFAVDLGFDTTLNVRVRLNGVDTPEIHSKLIENRVRAQSAKKFVSDAILNKQVVLKTYKVDKYGRYLADIFVNDNPVSINEQLIAAGHATSYDGGKKPTE
jgi:micrococcal nuclease